MRLLSGVAAGLFALTTAAGMCGQGSVAGRGAPAKSATAKSVAAGAETPHGEIVWDTYGVPHVFAKNVTGLFWGFGYAQMQGHGDLLLRLYGESRGRAAEYWGAKYAPLDRYLAAMGQWERAQDWYRQQTPAWRANFDAFAAGINAYGKEHPEKLADEVKAVLPVSGVDVVAHWERVMEFQYIASMARATGRGGPPAAAVELGDNELPADVQVAKLEQLDELEQDAGGSNAWAIAPAKTVDGHAMLLANPHLDWPPSYQTYFEAQLNAPGIAMYGATQVGLPVLRFCFNEDHALTNTVNATTASTTYKLTLAKLPDGSDGYMLDGKVKAFDKGSKTIKVKQDGGSLKDEVVQTRDSVFGPVFARADGTTIAIHAAGLDRPFGAQEYWDLDNAHGLTEFVAALKRLQIPMFNILYADKDGHILAQYNAMVPVRTHGDFAYWSGMVPGDTSENLWTKLHPYEDLPRTLDPPAGWVQNTNNYPWTNTALPILDPAKFPPYMSPAGGMTFRSEQSMLLLGNSPKLTFDDFVKLKMTTRSLMADRLLPELLAAAATSTSPQVQKAVAVLTAWNHYYDNDSRGALLFETWAAKFAGPAFSQSANYKNPFTLSDPLNTPNGLKDPAAAVAMLEAAAKDTVAKYGSIDRPWGEVNRFHLGDVNLPGNGGHGNTGSFRTINWTALKDGERNPLHGETYISMVEFSKPMKAMGIVTYGESSQPGSKHNGDELQLLSNKQLRPLWMTRAEVEQHVEERQSF
jgi:acyl-homoserine-lactone acylase